MDIHNKLNDQSKVVPGVGSEAWAQMMNLQNPLMQGLMGNYLDQSKELFINMQEQMKGSQNLFGGFPFAPSAKPTDKE